MHLDTGNFIRCDNSKKNAGRAEAALGARDKSDNGAKDTLKGGEESKGNCKHVWMYLIYI